MSTIKSALQSLDGRGLDRSHPLMLMLATAVPLWAERFSHTTLEHVFDKKELNVLADRLWVAGEALIYRVPGKSADGFNALAETIARLAYTPGGVRCFGMHFEYEIGNWRKGKHGVIDEGSAFLKSTATIVSDEPVKRELDELRLQVSRRSGTFVVRKNK